MLTVEGWTTIRFLHAQGKSIKAIAAELGVARNTVRLALRRDGPPAYARPARPNPQLAPFVDEIERMVLVERFIGSRVLRELKARGDTGGQTALYAYLRQRQAAQPDPRVSMRFETGPAEQGQFDWSPYTVALGGQATKVIVFCLTLGFSRRKIYLPSLVETQAAVFEALEGGFGHFGGAPKQVLVDNARALVSEADPARFRWNTRFLELCGHYRVEPVACAPGRARTKGKVERPFFYLEEHLIKGGAWADLDEVARDLRRFSAELDERVHGTTGERPGERFERERGLLVPLPARPFVGTHEEVRKVSWDCLVSFGGSRYSVPWPYAAKQVWLRPSRGTHLAVRNQRGEEIARHALAARKGVTVLEPAHYAGLRTDQPRTRALLAEAFARRFPDHGDFAAGVLAQQRTNATKHLRAVLALAEVYAPEALHAAFVAAREYNTYSHRFVRGLLEAGDATRRDPGPARGLQPPLLAVAADLRPYQRLLEAGR
jgi:transposase